MPNKKGRLIFVTGPPGTGVEKSLIKYINWRKITYNKEQPQIVKLESYLLQHAEKPLIELLGEREKTFYKILMLPKSVLLDLWLTAFKESYDKISEYIQSGVDVFFTFHSCWYHLRNREYISPIDLSKLNKISKQLLKPVKFITLIDDIYDTRIRLSDGGGIFSVQLIKNFELLDLIIKLLRILEW